MFLYIIRFGISCGALIGFFMVWEKDDRHGTSQPGRTTALLAWGT